MKAFIILPTLLAAATAAPQFLGGHVGLVRGAGQVSHQSVSKPFQGEHRSTVQSKAFGAGVASVSDSPNRLHGARGVIAHPVAHAFGHPVAHAIAHPVAPLVHSAPLIAHRPVIHAAPVIAHPVAHAIAHPVVGDGLAEVSPYNFNYAVNDDYSGSAYTAAESSDGLGTKTGSYTVALPDGRTQTVNYSTNDVEGYVADVTYDGVPSYPEAPVVAHAPLVSHAPLLAHAVAHPALVTRPAVAVAHPAPAHPIQG